MDIEDEGELEEEDADESFMRDLLMDKKLHAEAEGVKYIVFQVDSSTPDFFLNFARLSRRLPHGPHRRNVAQDFGRQPGRCTPPHGSVDYVRGIYDKSCCQSRNLP